MESVLDGDVNIKRFGVKIPIFYLRYCIFDIKVLDLNLNLFPGDSKGKFVLGK